MRATIMVTVGLPGEAETAEAWFEKWRPQLTHCSENYGCGCCVDIWDVDGPEEAIKELPVELRSRSEWSHPSQSRKPPKPPVRKKGQKLPKPRYG
jgi:hypothetical protein